MLSKSRLTSFILIVTSLIAFGMTIISFILPQKSYAATTCVGGGSSAPIINSVIPAIVNNKANTDITIIGSGFIDGASVVLEGFGAIPTVFTDSNTLTATVPAGVPGKASGKAYNLDVFNPTTTPNTDCAVLNSALTVIGIAPTALPATPAPTTFARPQIVVASYTASVTHVYPSQNFDFSVTLQSVGQITARNITATFVTGDLIPRDNGGVHYVGDLDPTVTVSFQQPMRVSGQVRNAEAVIKLQVVYNDDYGKTYTDNFDVAAFPVYYAASTPTPTPTLAYRSQLVLTSYQTTPAKLSPGQTFTVDMDVTNVSSELARQIVFNLNVAQESINLVAPLNSSNTRFVEQLQPGQSTHLQFTMVISGSASGQLIPVTLNMDYMDSGNNQQTQAENLSLRIETEPFLLVHFLTVPPSPIKVGDAIDIPVEVVNIGTNKLNVSTIEVISDTMTVTDGSLYIGPLDGGTSGVVSAKAVPQSAGEVTVNVAIHYLDDYQQEQTITRELTLQIERDPTPTPSASGNGINGQSTGFPSGSSNLTILDRIARLFLGFFGLATRSVGFGAGNFQQNGSNTQSNPGGSQNGGGQDFTVPAP